MTVVEALDRVRQAAEADARRDPVAHVQLLQEIHRLQLEAETPAEKTMRMRFQILQNLCVRIAIEYNVLQAIAAASGRPVTAAELSTKMGVDELLIIRIMRVITYAGICAESDYATYASNDTTAFITQKAFIGAEKHHTDLGFAIGARLVEMMRTNNLYQFPEGPGQKSPFEYTYGMGFFEYFEKDREQKEAFDDYMAARRDLNAPQWFEIYPAEQQLANCLGEHEFAVLLVDVGGGKGHECSKFRERFPHMPGGVILQDLPVTLKTIDTRPEGVTLMEHDFFSKQPVKGARLYYLRNIMHDWPDSKCLIILSEIVKAMDPKHSRILIDDYVLPNTNAEVRAASMDVLMMLYVSALERTQRQWEELLHSANLEIVQIWSAQTGAESIIEARVRS
ncbi:hypothetical protein LTR85_005858 [Meristemomyces frigidus]|nr:hypothetical protein LTR85_005858 [Meristemomyces frigidus]